MKANELSLGNWIMLDNDDVWNKKYNKTFTKLTIDDFVEITSKSNLFSPIPLTPEILEKAGFRQAITNDRIWLLRIGDTNLMLHIDGHAWSYSGPILIKIKYVHQLQNLYFALTGEELKIEL